MKASNLKITSQMPFCAYPLSMDTYAGCPHGCEYCFARTFARFSETNRDPTSFEVAQPRDYTKLLRAIRGEDIGGTILMHYIRQRQPVHIGGMADPFPLRVERRIRHSRGLIEAVGDYPIMWSTKNPLPEYADLMAIGNHVMQCSIIGFGNIYKKIEKITPTGEERLEALKAYKGKAKKLIIRWQPYMPWLHDADTVKDFVERISGTADAVVVEFLKKGSTEKFRELSETLGIDLDKTFRDWKHMEGTDFLIPTSIKTRHIQMVREQTDKHGIELYIGENELRDLGDGPNCCGISCKETMFASKMDYNLSHILFKLKAGGPIYLKDLIEEMPECFDTNLKELNWNAGNRKGYHEQIRTTTRDKFREYLTTKNTNHPAILFRNVGVKRDGKGIYFYYKGRPGR